MPPPTEAEPVRVELGPLRELLAVDRHGAGERRRAQATRDLTTVAYSMPLRAQWRRAFRRHRRLRVAAWSLCLSMVGALLIWQAPRLSAQAGKLSAQAGQAVRRVKSTTGMIHGLWLRSPSARTSSASEALSVQWQEAMRWAESASGMVVPGLWLQSSATGELSASERAPAP